MGPVDLSSSPGWEAEAFGYRPKERDFVFTLPTHITHTHIHTDTYTHTHTHPTCLYKPKRSFELLSKIFWVFKILGVHNPISKVLSTVQLAHSKHRVPPVCVYPSILSCPLLNPIQSVSLWSNLFGVDGYKGISMPPPLYPALFIILNSKDIFQVRDGTECQDCGVG